MKNLIAFLSCAAFLFFLQIYPNFMNPNESCRLLLTSAIVDDHSFQIDQAIRRYGDTQDKSLFNGHYYAAKPIGYSLVAVPFYFLLTAAIPKIELAAILILLRFFLNLIPLLFFTIFFFRYLRDDLRVSDKAYLLIAALLFGTLFYPFAQLFISHVLTGIMWFIAFYWIVERDTTKHALLAGSFLGFSFVIEILSVIPIGACGLWLLWRKRSMVLPFAAGVLIFSLPAFLFNYVVFGAPLEWTYRHVAEPGFQRNNAIGYVGLSFPSLKVLWELTFGTSRGFFFYMPHLLFGLWGLLFERKRKAESLLAFVIVAGTFLVVSGLVYWDGGWGFGPRYMIPVIPFLIYGCGLWLSRLKETTTSLHFFHVYLIFLAFSITSAIFGTSTFPYAPMLPNVIVREYWTLFWRGFFGLNWGDLIGLQVWMIQLLAILLVVVPVMSYLYFSRVSRHSFAVFFVSLTLLLTGSLALQKRIEKGIDAWQCYAIGIAGYYQANYPKALEFLYYSLERNPEERLRVKSRALINYIESIPKKQ